MSRVLHVQKVSGISGSEAHLLSVLPRLRARGWDARMLVLDEGEAGAAAFAARLEATGVPVERLRVARDADPVAWARLVGRIRALRPAVLHTHLVHGDVLGLTAGAVARVGVRVSTKHGFNAFREGRAFGLLDRGVARLATANVAISDGLARYLERVEGFRPGTFAVVRYGIEPGPEPPPPPGGPRLLCVGRLVPIKGHETLLRAAADVPGARLALAGSGPLEAELRALAARLGLDVDFLGHVSPVAPEVERALAVVVPSHGEGFGMVALEAMERARPVVASAVGGLPELVEDGVTGLLVPPGDPAALAAALRRLVDDPALARRLGEAGRARALERFSAEAPADRLDALYRGALAAR